jgi:hypothetical protein
MTEPQQDGIIKGEWDNYIAIVYPDGMERVLSLQTEAAFFAGFTCAFSKIKELVTNRTELEAKADLDAIAMEIRSAPARLEREYPEGRDL